MRLAKAKVIYYDSAFSASEGRVVLYCGVCNASRCIYSKKAIGEPNGPSKLQDCVPDQWTESGYA